MSVSRLGAPVVALLGLSSVASLLAWVYGLGSFAAWFWGLSAPATFALAAIGVVAARSAERDGRFTRLGAGITAGALGGLIGPRGYDLFRVPFVLA